MPLLGCREKHIGSRILDGSVTQVAISIYAKDGNDLIRSFRTGARDLKSLYEVRYDLFEKQDRQDLENTVRFLNERGVDYVFTFRSEDSDRLADYYGVASDLNVPAADIEVSVYEELKRSTKFRSLILSHHSFSGERVAEVYGKIFAHNPDIIKLAAIYKDYESFQMDFMHLMEMKKRDRACLSYIPMGERFRFLRVVSAYAFSDLVYAREENETAEGQLTLDEYERCFSLF